MPHLFVTLGYPGAGKSYFSRQLASKINAVRLNGDGARHEMFKSEAQRWNAASHQIVFGALDYATKQILSTNVSVIYDASHNRRRDRQKASDLGAPFGIHPIIIWVQTPLSLAKQREATRDITDDQVVVEQKHFDRLVANLQPPEPDEFCIVIDGQQSFDEQFQSFSSQLAKTDLL